MDDLTKSECDREIQKTTRTIILLIFLNICPVYAGSGQSTGLFQRWNCLLPCKVILGVSVCTDMEFIIWSIVPFSIIYNIIGRVHYII